MKKMVEKGKHKNFNRTSFEDSVVLREVNDVLTRRFGKDIWLKGMYNDEVIYIGCEKHHSIKIRIEVVE